MHPAYSYAWAGGLPAPGPGLVLGLPFYPGGPLIPFGPPPAAAAPESPSSPDDSGIETVSDEADGSEANADDAADGAAAEGPSKQTETANDSEAVDSA